MRLADRALDAVVERPADQAEQDVVARDGAHAAVLLRRRRGPRSRPRGVVARRHADPLAGVLLPRNRASDATRRPRAPARARARRRRRAGAARRRPPRRRAPSAARRSSRARSAARRRPGTCASGRSSTVSRARQSASSVEPAAKPTRRWRARAHRPVSMSRLRPRAARRRCRRRRSGSAPTTSGCRGSPGRRPRAARRCRIANTRMPGTDGGTVGISKTGSAEPVAAARVQTVWGWRSPSTAGNADAARSALSRGRRAAPASSARTAGSSSCVRARAR